VPALALTPAKDRLVPLESSTALAEALPDCRQLVPDAGHIGMITGSRARAGVWEPLAAWLRSLAA
jgi:polyhydroxyalkanoate synthase